MLSDWRGFGNSCRNPIFVTLVSVYVASGAVTFYYSSMILPFLKLDLGINRREFQLGIWWCYRIGVELRARVAIRFFVTMVSVCICSVVVTFTFRI